MNRVLMGVMMAFAAVGVVLAAAYVVATIRDVPESPALNPAAQSGESDAFREGSGLEGYVGVKSETVAVGVGRSTTQLDVTIAPAEVVEDSRCPAGVSCLTEGTVRARVKVTGGSEYAEEVMALGDAVTTEDRIVTFLRAEPEATSNGPVAQSEYRLVFRIERR